MATLIVTIPRVALDVMMLSKDLLEFSGPCPIS